MPAECWGCAARLATTGGTSPAPLGVCVLCGVLGCDGHAERDRKSHKWLCTPSVAAAVSAGAGIDDELDVPEELQITSAPELEERFPQLAGATRDTREWFRAGEGEGLLGPALEKHPPRAGASWEMLATAVGLGWFLTHEGPPGIEAMEREAPASALPLRLAAIVRAIPR